MISALQRRIASILTSLPESEGFALGGGAALIALQQVTRVTGDLDFFTTDPGSLHLLVPALEEALRRAGLEVELVKHSETFVRFEVSDGTETSEVDLATDARMLPVGASDLGPVLSLDELAADKTLALFDRAQPRDFIDFFNLEERYGLNRLCELASEKDPGFSRSLLGEALAAFYRLPRDEFDVADGEVDRLVAAVERWRAVLK